MLLDVLFALVVSIQGTEAPLSVEDEVLGNIRGQRVGPATIADFAQPEAFHRRFADRVILAWYSERFRAIVADPPDPNASTAKPADPSPTTPAKPASNASTRIEPPARAPLDDGASASWTWRIVAAVVALASIAWLLARKRRTA